MSKRFTDTDKWRDPWFTELEPVNKLIWLYLIDNCNQIGVIDFSKRMADFLIGENTDIVSFIDVCDSRVEVLSDGKLIITKFLSFQNGKISQNSPAHKPIIKLLSESEDAFKIINSNNPNTINDTLLDTLLVGYCKGTSNSKGNSNSNSNGKDNGKSEDAINEEFERFCQLPLNLSCNYIHIF